MVNPSLVPRLSCFIQLQCKKGNKINVKKMYNTYMYKRDLNLLVVQVQSLCSSTIWISSCN